MAPESGRYTPSELDVTSSNQSQPQPRGKLVSPETRPNPGLRVRGYSPHVVWSFRGYGHKSPPNHPFALPITLSNIPFELQVRDQWVCWNWSWRDGNWGKPTISAETEGNADETNPETWSSFEKALQFAELNDLSGIGYVFSADDEFIGIDLDACRNPSTGDLETWAKEIVDLVDSYSELSPSKSGIHIVARGQLATTVAGRKILRPEVYDRNQYFTFTGSSIHYPVRPVSHRQEQIDDVISSHSHVSKTASSTDHKNDDSIRSACINDHYVIAYCWDNALYGLDSQTGRQLWSQQSTGCPSTIAIIGSTAYIGFDESLMALDPASGGVIWDLNTYSFEIRFEPEWIFTQDSIFLVGYIEDPDDPFTKSPNCGLIEIDPASGIPRDAESSAQMRRYATRRLLLRDLREQIVFQWRPDMTSSPTFQEEQTPSGLASHNLETNLLCLDNDHGQIGIVGIAPYFPFRLSSDARVLFAVCSNLYEILAIDAASGTNLWRYQAFADELLYPLCEIDGMVYVLECTTPSLRVLNSKKGDLEWEVPLTGHLDRTAINSRPAVYKPFHLDFSYSELSGILYIRSGHVVCAIEIP